jgi:hypothetical protein
MNTSTLTLDREFFQKLLESAFTVQQSQMDGESLSAIVELERSMMGEEPADGAMPLGADGTLEGTLNVDNASEVAVGPLAAEPVAVGPPRGVQSPLPGLEELEEDDRSFGLLLSHLASALSPVGGGEVSADTALDLVLKDIVERARLATHASAAAIALIRGGEMVCRASTEANAPELGLRLRSPFELSAECMQTREAQFCDDTGADSRVDAIECGRLGIRSFLIFPVLKQEKLVGLFEVFSPRPHAFGRRDTQTLQSLSRQLLIHVECALEVSTSAPAVEPRTAADGGDASFAPSQTRPPEVTNHLFRPLGLWTSSLIILVIAFAVLLGWMLGRVTSRGTARFTKGPPLLASATPNAAPSQSKETRRADSNPPPPVTQKTGTPETPSGGLVVYEPSGGLVVYQDGKAIFRLKPSTNVTPSGPKPGETMPRRQIFASKNTSLKPRARTEAIVSLVIMDGTPEATLEIDGKTMGRLEANGSLELPNALTEGQHSIVLAKANFESREFPVTAKPPEFRLPDAKLTPWPTLTFQTTTPNVTVKYQRSGDSQVHQAPAAEKLILQPGQYDFTAEAPGFENYTTKVNLVPGYEGSIPLKLDTVPDNQFQDATQVVHDGPVWFKSKNAHAFVQLKPGLLHETLIFTKPPKRVFWNKKIEWEIEASDRSAGVDYIVDGQKMVRKLVIGEAASDIKEAKVDVTAATQATSLSVQIDVDGSHVQIRNDKGLVIDSYTAPQHNFSGGRIAIKTESHFVVRDSIFKTDHIDSNRFNR